MLKFCCMRTIYKCQSSSFNSRLLRSMQGDLNCQCLYCNKNDLFLNANKCRVIRFTRYFIIFNYNYTPKTIQLTFIEFIKDLQERFYIIVIFCPHFNFLILYGTHIMWIQTFLKIWRKKLRFKLCTDMSESR